MCVWGGGGTEGMGRGRGSLFQMGVESLDLKQSRVSQSPEASYPAWQALLKDSLHHEDDIVQLSLFQKSSCDLTAEFLFDTAGRVCEKNNEA